MGLRPDKAEVGRPSATLPLRCDRMVRLRDHRGLATQLIHLALDSLLSDWLSPEHIPRVRRDPDAPTSDWEDGPEVASPGKEPDRDEKAVDSKVDRKVRPESCFRLKPFHCTLSQLIISGISWLQRPVVGRLVDPVLRRHFHRLLSLQAWKIDLHIDRLAMASIAAG